MHIIRSETLGETLRESLEGYFGTTLGGTLDETFCARVLPRVLPGVSDRIICMSLSGTRFFTRKHAFSLGSNGIEIWCSWVFGVLITSYEIQNCRSNMADQTAKITRLG